MAKIIGIYQILNKSNSKNYIGSSFDIKHRFRQHKHELRLNKHANSYLQNTWNKYGEDNFDFKIVNTFDDITKEELGIIENLYINKLNCLDRLFGYNILSEAYSSFGYKHTNESRAIMSEKRKGVEPWNKGKTGVYSDEMKQRMFRHLKRKQVVSFNIYDNSIVKVYESITSAANDMKCTKQSISACLNGNRPTCRGFKWKYYAN